MLSKASTQNDRSNIWDKEGFCFAESMQIKIQMLFIKLRKVLLSKASIVLLIDKNAKQLIPQTMNASKFYYYIIFPFS